MKTPCKFEPPEKHDDPFVSTAKFRETANLGEKSGVSFTTAAALVNELMEARDERRSARASKSRWRKSNC